MPNLRTASRIVLCIFLVASALLPTGNATRVSLAQENGDETRVDPFVEDLLARLSVAEKIGQLFIVAFEGSDLAARSAIVDLIANHKVGGVMPLNSNDNFVNDETLIEQVTTLNRGLQQWAGIASVTTVTVTAEITATTEITVTVSPTATPPITVAVTPTATAALTGSERLEGEQVEPTSTVTVTVPISPGTAITSFIETTETVPRENFVPLLIATEHEGDGYPYTHLRTGLTPIPSNMAIGATWNAENALAVGQIVGRELNALGFNMLLGPSLDVLDRPLPERPSDLGTRSFGGDPYWVGVMGQAYIRGVHLGSQGKVSTVAKHFPGLGRSDRRINQEVITVRKSLEELRRMELVPFFAVTQPVSEDLLGVTDAVMTAFVRFGDVRPNTKPVSFDAEAMLRLMGLPGLSSWRSSGGVIVSDSLGAPAVRKYSDPYLGTFNHRYIAREALNAGNDLLLLSEFSLDGSWEAHYRNIVDTIEFFREQYETDLSFQARVDEAVRRILTLKHRLYPEFSPDAVSPDLAYAQSIVGTGSTELLRLPQQSISLLSPESTARLPDPPGPDEEILIFVDDREVADCAQCEPFYLIEPSALKQTLVRLYGPEASGRVDPARIHTHTFTELNSFLFEPETSPDVVTLLEARLPRADWLLFAMLDVDTERHPQSDMLQEFLSRRNDVLQGKKVVVLAYNAPYFLDTTEVSKLTAYYCMYSKLQSYVDVSIRALFQEFPPLGDSPVTVEGINYYLYEQMQPDPSQLQRVEVHQRGLPEVGTEGTPQPIEVRKGDRLQLYTSVILDRNGRPVPDGTAIEFRFFYTEEKLEERQEVTTVAGVASIEFVLDRAGSLEISVIGSQAKLVAKVPEEENVEFQTVVPPTDTPTATATWTPTPTDTPTATPTNTPRPTSTPTPTATATATPIPVKRVTGMTLSVTVVGVLAVGAALFAAVLARGLGLSSAVRWALLSIVGGLLGYDLYAMGLPGALKARQISERWGAILVSVLGIVVINVLGMLVRLLVRRMRRSAHAERQQ